MPESKQSDINGHGYGDCHSWKRGQTRPVYNGQHHLKNTTYTCEKCNVTFAHYYDIERDIFEAIRKANVPNICN